MHPKYTALFTTVNLLLGVGPLILPSPFFEAGVGLSTIWMVLITLLSYNSAMYIAESMAKVRQIEYNNGLQNNQTSDQPTQEQINKNSLLSQQNNDSQKDADQSDTNKEYDHSFMFQILYGQKWKHIPSVAIAIYLTGTCISKCIMTGKILSRVFTDVDAPGIFDDFRFWLAIFFVSGALFSFKSIEKTKIMQTIIISVRFISIALFIIGAIYLFSTEGIKDLTPPNEGLFVFENFVDIFSNSVFSFMFHHSFPNIASNLRTTEDVAFVGRAGFLISGSILMILPWTASMAFGNDLGKGGQLVYYNFDFENKISSVYWVTSFYVFLNIAAFSVYVIVIRTYILKIIYPTVNPRLLSRHTLISSGIILIIVLLASFFLKNEIQIVLDFTGGIFGTVILFLIPSLEVWKAREMIHREGAIRNYISWLPKFVFLLGLGFMAFNLYSIISKLEK